MKKDCIQTTVLVPKKLYDEYKKRKLNLSNFVTEQLQLEIYRDKPGFIREKIEDMDKKHERSKDLLRAQLKVAEEKHQLKKERVGTSIPEVMDYRTTTPSKKKEDK